MKPTDSLIGVAAISMIVGLAVFFGIPAFFVGEPDSLGRNDVVAQQHVSANEGTGGVEQAFVEDEALVFDETSTDSAPQSDKSIDNARPELSPERAQELAREAAEEEVEQAYSLLIEKLNLADEQYAAMKAFLVEDALSAGRSSHPVTSSIDDEDRLSILRSIIGDARLEKFLEMEQFRNEFGEAQRFQSLLKERDVDMTNDQRDDFLDVLVKTKKTIGEPSIPADLTPIESLERQLDEIDEYERLVIELAPSVLSMKQVNILFDQYQARSYDRARVMENHKQAAAEGNEDMVLWYPPRYD